MIIGLRLGLSLATPLAAFLGTAVVEKHKQRIPITPIVTKQKIAERLALAQLACNECILDKAYLTLLEKKGVALSHLGIERGVLSHSEIIKILTQKSSASNRCRLHNFTHKLSLSCKDFAIVKRYLINPVRRLGIKLSGVQSLISVSLCYATGIIESGKSAAAFAALAWPAWYFVLSKLIPSLSESKILELQKEWRDSLLLNEDMGYYPHDIPTEDQMRMAYNALEKMGVKQHIIVRMMQQRYQDTNQNVGAYANCLQGLMCLRKNLLDDILPFTLLHEASHLANFDGTPVARRYYAECEAMADRDAIKAIACKECAYHTALSSSYLRCDGYLARSIMIDIIAKRSDWGQPCSRHTSN